jgi:hypothetical protein
MWGRHPVARNLGMEGFSRERGAALACAAPRNAGGGRSGNGPVGSEAWRWRGDGLARWRESRP